ncbi:MAG TPA: glycoside hydrolase family 18 protein [Lunatimonas sp.]|nr:glycoside hydrolase family 18 protein [Lunatimonas sp.]
MKSILSAISGLCLISFLWCCGSKGSLSKEDDLQVMAYYYVGWKNYDVEKLPLEKLTHIIYSFTEVIDDEMKFKNDSSGVVLRSLVEKRKDHPHLKVMIACGGWGGSGGFSDMAKAPETRKKFVESVVQFINDYELDGLDIDWEYPGLKGIGNPYMPEDKENFTSLMKELRHGLDGIGEHQLLTFAAAGWERFFHHIELPKVMEVVDYINIMSYDLAGGGNPYTAHHTNLGWVTMEDIAGTPAYDMKVQDLGDSAEVYSAEKIIAYCMENGARPEQIIIGAAFYGKGWVGVPPDNNGLYQKAAGAWTGSGSYAAIRENFEHKGGFIRHWDPVAKAPFLYHPADSIFISYEDTVSIKLKTRYAADTGLGGIMFWQLGSDAPDDGLVDAIYEAKMKK